MDAIPEPAITCLMAETINTASPPTTGYDRFWAADLAHNRFGGFAALERHFDGSNYAFMDGHAKWLKEETVRVPHADNTAIKFYW